MIVRRRVTSAYGRVRNLAAFPELSDGAVYNTAGGNHYWWQTNPDGLGKIPDFSTQYDRVKALSRAVDALVDSNGSDPAVRSLHALEVSMGDAIVEAIKSSAGLFQWDSLFGRSSGKQAQLDAATQAAYNAMSAYIGAITTALQSAQNALAQRQAAAQAAAQAVIDHQAAVDAAAAAAANAQNAAAQAAAAQSSSQAAQSTAAAQQASDAAAVAHAQAIKTVADAQAPRFLGVKYSTLAALALVGGAAFAVSNRRHSKA